MQAILDHWQLAGAILGFWITFAFAVPLAWPLIVRLPKGRNLNRSWTAWAILMLCWMTMVPIASIVVVLIVMGLLGRISPQSWVNFIFVGAAPLLGACVLGGFVWAHYHYSPPNYFWRSRADRLKLAAGLAVAPSIAVFFILLQLYSMLPFPDILSRLRAPGKSSNEVWVFEVNTFEDGGDGNLQCGPQSLRLTGLKVKTDHLVPVAHLATCASDTTDCRAGQFPIRPSRIHFKSPAGT